MDRAAGVDKERRRLSVVRALRIDGNRTGILDMNLRALADRRDARRADVGLRLDRKVFAVQVDIQRLPLIDGRDRGADIAHPCARYNQILAGRDRGVLREDISTIRLANTGIHIWSIMCFLSRDGCGKLRSSLGSRRLNKRCINIAALARSHIKGDVLKTLARSRGRQPFSNLHLAREVPLTRRISRVPKLVGKGIERCVYEILLCYWRCRFHIKPDIIRDQRDAAAAQSLFDDNVTALDICRCRSIMGKEHLCIAVVVVDRDVSVVLLEDYPGLVWYRPTIKSVHMAAREAGRQRRPLLLILPNGSLLEPEIDFPIAMSKSFEIGGLRAQGDIHPARRIL